MIQENIFESVLAKIEGILESQKSASQKLKMVCTLLKNNIAKYDWVGFYIVDTDHDRELILGPFAGEPTDHVRIKFGQGICGQAAEREETFIVKDVSAAGNYLACSLNVKSEIVVPIFKDKKIFAELDIDSHTIDAFDQSDEKFLKQIGDMVVKLL